MIVQHELKCWPECFQAIKEGKKTFEIRRNDRDFKVNDILYLKEYEPNRAYLGNNDFAYSGRFLKAKITYMIQGPAFEQQPGMVVMSIVLTDKTRDCDIFTEKGRLALYKEMFVDWSDVYRVDSFTGVGFCEYMDHMYNIKTHGPGQLKKVLPELWDERLTEKFYYWPGHGSNPDQVGRKERCKALLRAIEKLQNKLRSEANKYPASGAIMNVSASSVFTGPYRRLIIEASKFHGKDPEKVLLSEMPPLKWFEGRLNIGRKSLWIYSEVMKEHGFYNKL